jgi:serine protease AprX
MLMKTASKNFPVSSIATDPVTGTVYTITNDLFTVGAGYLDIWAALNNNDAISPYKRALSPSVRYDSALRKVVLVNQTNIVWGDIGFARNVVWGDHVLQAGNIVWGDNVVWGDATNQGFNIVWGDNVVWGDANPSADTVSVAIHGEN